MEAGTGTDTTKRSLMTTSAHSRFLTNVSATLIQLSRQVRRSILTMIPTVTNIRKLVGLLHLASPALPIGAYSYSQGLEAAVDTGLVTTPRAHRHGYKAASSISLPVTNSRYSRCFIASGKTGIIRRFAG